MPCGAQEIFFKGMCSGEVEEGELSEGGLQEVESDLVDGLRGRASRSCYVWNIHLVMLDQLPQKEWGLREVFRRN